MILYVPLTVRSITVEPALASKLSLKLPPSTITSNSSQITLNSFDFQVFCCCCNENSRKQNAFNIMNNLERNHLYFQRTRVVADVGRRESDRLVAFSGQFNHEFVIRDSQSDRCRTRIEIFWQAIFAIED